MKRQLNFGVITLLVIVLIACGSPDAAPIDPATLSPPPDLTTTPSPQGAYFTATPRPPIPSPTVYGASTLTLLPPPPAAIWTPGFDWEGPAILYDGLKLSNYDGSQKKAIPIPVVISPWYSDYSPEAGRIVTTVDTGLWTFDVRTGIQRRLSVNESLNHYIESPVITRDGTKIAYSLVHGFGEEDIQQ